MLSSARCHGAVAVLRRRALKVPERAAILFVAVLLVMAAAVADDTKPRAGDGSASAGAKAASAYFARELDPRHPR